jgi:uncharacterized cupin superfamily protein
MDLLMPQLGETVGEGKITKWFKSACDTVKPGDNHNGTAGGRHAHQICDQREGR